MCLSLSYYVNWTSWLWVEIFVVARRTHLNDPELSSSAQPLPPPHVLSTAWVLAPAFPLVSRVTLGIPRPKLDQPATTTGSPKQNYSRHSPYRIFNCSSSRTNQDNLGPKLFRESRKLFGIWRGSETRWATQVSVIISHRWSCCSCPSSLIMLIRWSPKDWRTVYNDFGTAI